MDEDTYLTAQYKDRDAVKALGARWDPTARSWYVPAGRELAPFAAWLPAGIQGEATSPSRALASSADQSSGEVAVVRKGTTLSQLLAGVTEAVAQAFKGGVWTMVEVVDARLRSGHVYLEVSERTARGDVVAKATAVIWATAAARILPEFERATGAKVGPGIKLLLRMRPVFKAQYGFSLEVDAIDPEYTLGDLEAKKREIRQRLQREGLFDANKQLPAPWDFNAVLVLAPEAAAGLGDFQAEAQRLAQFGVCRFVYAHSRFQGEGAAAEIRTALLEALDSWRGAPPDAVVLIRGGGAVNDLAWLNDYELARCICELDFPVFTGIGHERDSTVLDEVAHTKFDTPSKVILGIEQVIRTRVTETKSAFEYVQQWAARTTALRKREVDQLRAAAVAGALQHVARARQTASEDFNDIRLGALGSLRDARALTQEGISEVKHLATQEVASARQVVPATYAAVLERAEQATRLAGQSVERGLDEVKAGVRRIVIEATTSSEALMREVAGQGPEKTLGRGFAFVRAADGRTVTSAANISGGDNINIQFRDGIVPARAVQGSDLE